MKHELSDLDTVVVIIQDKIKDRTLCIVSAYLDINYSPAVGKILQDTVSESEALNWGLLVADSNSHSTTWGSATQNPRGSQVEGFIATNDLALQNVGNAFTYVSSRYETIIDITLTNRKLESHIYDWEVRKEETHSDHKRIIYSLDFDSTSSRESRDYKTANWGLLGAILTRKTQKLDSNPKWDKRRLDLAAEKVENDIKSALDKICPKKIKQVGLSKPGSLDWFTPETKKLSNIAKECIRLHRRNPTAATLLRHRKAKRQLQNNIRNNKKSSDQSLCAKLNDLKSFSKMAKSLTGSKAPPIGMLQDPVTGIETSSTSEVARVLLDTHFPGSTEPNPNPKPSSQKTKFKVVDLEHKDFSFITQAY
jgi:hypothetical protein